MENDILESLIDLGYEGPLTEVVPFAKALEGGLKSLEFTKLVHILAEELKQLCNLEETVNMMNDPEDCSSFLLELSSFLKELSCPYKKLVTGHMSSRLQTKEDCILLLDYLISELMAARMVNVDCPKEKPGSAMVVVEQESQTAKDLKDIVVSLKFNKPPNITLEMLFFKLENKLKEAIQKEGQQVVGKPLYNKAVSEKEWRELETVFNEMFEEYRCRRETLITRLECTIQSFEWSDRLKDKRDAIQSTFLGKRGQLKTKPAVRVSELLAARTSLLLVEKTSSASARRNTQTHVNKVIIGHVPDRGGRPNEQQPPPPEMPSWQPRITPPGGGLGGWRGGRYSGEWDHVIPRPLYPTPLEQRQRFQTYEVPPGGYNQGGYSQQGHKGHQGYNQDYSQDSFDWGECNQNQGCQQQIGLNQVSNQSGCDQNDSNKGGNDIGGSNENVNEIENSDDSIKVRSEEINENCMEVRTEQELVIIEDNGQANDNCEELSRENEHCHSQNNNQNQENGQKQSNSDIRESENTKGNKTLDSQQGSNQSVIESDIDKQDNDPNNPQIDNIANNEPTKQVREIIYENMDDYDNESDNDGVLNLNHQSDDEVGSGWHDVDEENIHESDNECKIYQGNTVDVIEVESSDDENQTHSGNEAVEKTTLGKRARTSSSERHETKKARLETPVQKEHQNNGNKAVETTVLGKRARTSSPERQQTEKAKIETTVQNDNQNQKEDKIDLTVGKNISDASNCLFFESIRVYESIAKVNNPTGSSDPGPSTVASANKKKGKKARKRAKRVAWWESRGKSSAEAKELAKLPLMEYPEYIAEIKAIEARKRAEKCSKASLERPKKDRAVYKQGQPKGSYNRLKGGIRLGIVNIQPMCTEELETLQYELLALAAREEWGNGPDLRNLKYTSGAMAITCMNEASRQWLFQHVTSSWQPFNGARLSIVNEKSLHRPKYGTLWFPNALLSGEEVLKLLSHLNQGIDFRLWRPVARREVKKGQLLTFAVDLNSFKTLIKREFVLHTNYRDLRIQFKG